MKTRLAHGLLGLLGLLAAVLLVVAAEEQADEPPSDTGRAFSLVSLPSLLPSLLSGPSFNLFNINKPPINIGGGSQPPPAPAYGGGLFGLPPSVWVVNSAGTASSGGSSATAGSATAGSRRR